MWRLPLVGDDRVGTGREETLSEKGEPALRLWRLPLVGGGRVGTGSEISEKGEPEHACSASRWSATTVSGQFGKRC